MANLNFFDLLDKRRSELFEKYIKPILNIEVKDSQNSKIYIKFHNYAEEVRLYLDHLNKASEEYRKVKSSVTTKPL